MSEAAAPAHAACLQRYLVACRFAAGRDTLDLSEGPAAGAALLAQVAGGLVSLHRTGAGAIRSGLAGAATADPAALPLRDGCMDVVVAFDRLQQAPDAVLAEILRVLRPDGVLLASGPEMLAARLRRRFAHVAGFRQQALAGAVLLPADGPAPPPWMFARAPSGAIHMANGLAGDGLVLLAAQHRLPPLASIYVADPEPEGPLQQRADLALALQAAQADRARLAAALAAARSVPPPAPPLNAALPAPVALPPPPVKAAAPDPGPPEPVPPDTARLALERAERQAEEATRLLLALQASLSWRVTAPLRAAAARFPLAARQGRRLALAVWWTLTGQLPRRHRLWRQAVAARRAAEAPGVLQAAPAPAAIRLRPSPRPEVSIVIPCHGHVDFTLRCLAAIAACPDETAYEVIVAEDASGDPAVARLRAVAGIVLLERAENLGFLHSSNDAARRARGDFVVFLNNDTQVRPGWLDAMAGLLHARPDAGGVGAKLLFPDGRLQEAGGIVWRDGSAWNYGRLDDPRRPVYNYVREIDYASGAALMVRRSVLERLGGFDPHFAPAYCEDSDLAFRMRAIGLKLLYQPLAEVVHFEGVSHGTDLGQGIKAWQRVNQARLAARWAAVLAAEHLPSGTGILRARDRAVGRKVVLVIDHYVPQPDRDAGSRTMRAFIAALLAAGRVVKFWPDNGAHSPGYSEALQQMGVEICTGGFEAWIAENGAEIDSVLLSRPHVAERYLAPLRAASAARLVYYGHDLHFARLRLQARLELGDVAATLRAAAETEAQERRIWRQVDLVLYPSQEEADTAAGMEPAIDARAMVPYSLDRSNSTRTSPACARILFVAGFAHPPNEDAARWFVAEILPLVRAARPDAALLIVGSNPTPAVRALAGPGVSVHANVTDAALAGFYADARVAVVPLRFGAGVKLKVVEALADGLPLVATPVAAQGYAGLEQVVAVHADPAGFAAAVCRLLDDDTLWATCAAEQIAYARAHFAPGAMQAALDRLI